MIHFLCIAQGVTEMSFRLRSFSFFYSLLRKIMELHSLKLPVSPKLLFHIGIIIFLVHHVPSNLLYCYFWLSMSQNYQTAEPLSRLFGDAVRNMEIVILKPAITSGFLLWTQLSCIRGRSLKLPTWAVMYRGRNFILIVSNDLFMPQSMRTHLLYF